MAVKITGMAQWERSMKKVIAENWQIEHEIGFEVRDGGADSVESLPKLLEEWLQEFMQIHYLSETEGVLYREFQKGNNPDHWPMFEVSGQRTRMSRKSKVNMGDGFDALWNTIAEKPVVRREGNRIVAGVGRMSKIMDLRLNRYMGNSGSTTASLEFNSLFLAAEFGTGVEENVGHGNVRLDGDTKDPSEPGAWWFGSNSQNDDKPGTLFYGQKAMHFLYDERRQKPKALYADHFHRNFPRFVKKKLREMGSKMRVASGTSD